MTLDEAEEAFRENPTLGTVVQFLDVAMDYWKDGMIYDSTFEGKVRMANEWLKQHKEVMSRQPN